jgi:hypothetical protein
VGPGWCDVLRFAAGTRLCIECVLKPALREALAGAGAPVAGWLAAMPGGSLSVEAIGSDHCRLRCDAGRLTALLCGERRAGPSHRLRAEIRKAEGSAAFECDDIALMLGGACEAYIARRAEQGTQLLAQLRYEDAAGGVLLSIMTAALAGHMTAAQRALAPARLALLRLLPSGRAP